MGLYIRRNSPYWWMYLPPVRKQVSTGVLVKGATPAMTREQRQLAEVVYQRELLKLKERAIGLARPEPITFDAYADWYERTNTEQKRGAERERWAIAVLREAFGTERLTAITKEAVLDWRAERAKEVRVGTVNRELDVLKHMLATAVPKYLKDSPIAALPRLREKRGEKRERQVLSKADEQKLLAVLAPDDRALVVLAICTLLRLGDLLDLRWSDYHGTWLSVRDPKTGIPYKVPVAKRARAAVAALKKGRSPYLFPRRRQGDEEERRNRIKLMLRYACKRAGIRYGMGKGITFHSLRHTGATRMGEAGVDPRTLQEIGGWKTLAQVMRYTHPAQKHKRAAVEQI